MTRRELFGSVAALAACRTLAGPTRAMALTPLPAPPVTPSRPQRIVQLGRVRIDDYAWLKPANWKAVWRDPTRLPHDIRAHLDDENRYADAVLAEGAPLRKALLAEIQAKTPAEQTDAPQPDGPFAYLERYAPGAQHPLYLRRRRDGGQEEVLLDAEAAALKAAQMGRPYLAIAGVSHSPDHQLFAWAQDDIGSENFTIYVKDLATGAVLPGPVQQAYGDFVFSPDSQWLFWTWRSPDSRPTKVFRRPARGGGDVLVYEETDPGYLMQISRTASNAYVVIRIWNADTSEVRLVPAAAPTATPQLVEHRQPGVLYSLEHWNDRFVILTNADGAVDFKLMWADEADPSRRTWRSWIEHRPGCFITGMRAFKDHFVRTERSDAQPRVIIAARGSLVETEVAFDEAAYAVTLNAGDEYDTGSLRLIYQSPRLPRQWIEVDMSMN